jgi:hypothetical protein
VAQQDAHHIFEYIARYQFSKTQKDLCYSVYCIESFWGDEKKRMNKEGEEKADKEDFKR